MGDGCGASGGDNRIAPSSAPNPQPLSPDRTTCGRKEAASTVAQDWGAGLKFMDILKRLFEEHFRLPVDNVQPLQGDLGGSGRKIIRLKSSGTSAVGILYGVREENKAFLEFSRHFRRHGLPVPEIYAEDLAQGAYLEEDLGDTTLFDFLSQGRAGESISPPVVEAYRKVVAILPRFQVEAGREIGRASCRER